MYVFWKFFRQPLRVMRHCWRVVTGRGIRVTFYFKSGNKVTADLQKFSIDGKGIKWTDALYRQFELMTIRSDDIEAIIVER